MPQCQQRRHRQLARLPRVLQGKWNITPSASLVNVQSGPFAVRSNFSGGEWVRQNKRPSFGLSATPTVYGLFPGFGPFARFRHALNPQVSWSYSPDATRRKPLCCSS